jgi:hypothetical protein
MRTAHHPAHRRQYRLLSANEPANDPMDRWRTVGDERTFGEVAESGQRTESAYPTLR